MTEKYCENYCLKEKNCVIPFDCKKYGIRMDLKLSGNTGLLNSVMHNDKMIKKISLRETN